MPAAKLPATPPTTWPATDAVTFFVMPFGLTIVPAISGPPSAVDASSAMGLSFSGGDREGAALRHTLQGRYERVDVVLGGSDSDAGAYGAWQLRFAAGAQLG